MVKMQTNYQKVISQLSLKLASLEVNNAILEDQLEQREQLINDQKLKHPEDFPADNDKKPKEGVQNGKKV